MFPFGVLRVTLVSCSQSGRDIGTASAWAIRWVFSSSSASRRGAKTVHQIRQPPDGLGVVSKVQHELLPSADTPQVGVVGVATPASSVRAIRQRACCRQGRTTASAAFAKCLRGLGRSGPVSVELGKRSPSGDTALVVSTSVQLYGSRGWVTWDRPWTATRQRSIVWLSSN